MCCEAFWKNPAAHANSSGVPNTMISTVNEITITISDHVNSFLPSRCRRDQFSRMEQFPVSTESNKMKRNMLAMYRKMSITAKNANTATAPMMIHCVRLSGPGKCHGSAPKNSDDPPRCFP